MYPIRTRLKKVAINIYISSVYHLRDIYDVLTANDREKTLQTSIFMYRLGYSN